MNNKPDQITTEFFSRYQFIQETATIINQTHLPMQNNFQFESAIKMTITVTRKLNRNQFVITFEGQKSMWSNFLTIFLFFFLRFLLLISIRFFLIDFTVL